MNDSSPTPVALAAGAQSGGRNGADVAEVALERSRWDEMVALIEILTDDERLAPGYYVDPDWSVKDLIAHLGFWFAEARTELLDIAARSYIPHDMNVDARNAIALVALKREPWDVVWARAIAARAWMIEAWVGLDGRAEIADRWIRKAGAEHYGEHLPRLRAWVGELVVLRTRPRRDEWEG